MKEEIQQFDLVLEQKPKTPDVRAGWTSASNAQADELCAGRHNAQRGLPDLPRDDDYAEHGIAIHDALAKRDPSKLTEAALKTYELCLEVEEKVVIQFFGEEASDLMTIAEERFWVIIDKNLRHSAQVDRVYRSKTKALVIEYKTLPGEVPSASSNLQIRDQVVLTQGNLLVNNIACVVIQPLVTMNPEVCVYNPEQIKAATKLMFDRVRNSNEQDAKRTAGVVQCNFCKAKHQCVEYSKFAAEQVPVMNDFIGVPAASWTAEQCLVFLERHKAAEQWLDETKSAIRKRVEQGEIPGWGIGKGDRKFEVTDMTELFTRAEALGIPNASLVAICKPNKEALEKLVRAATKTKGKGLIAKVDSLLDGIIKDERKSGSLEKTT